MSRTRSSLWHRPANHEDATKWVRSATSRGGLIPETGRPYKTRFDSVAQSAIAGSVPKDAAIDDVSPVESCSQSQKVVERPSSECSRHDVHKDASGMRPLCRSLTKLDNGRVWSRFAGASSNPNRVRRSSTSFPCLADGTETSRPVLTGFGTRRPQR